MPRTTPSEKIQTRAARSRLSPQRKPHWLCLRPGQVHLGYVRRQVTQAGHWTVRRYNGGGAYKVTRLPGIADDVEPADGGGVLSFAQAQDLALRATPQAAATAPMTVAQALADYVDYLQTQGREGAAVTAARTGRLHVLPQLGPVAVQALTTDQLRHWLAALATGLAKRRHGHEDAVRRSRATANRILGTLRAALNHAYAECRVPSDNAWRGRLKPFRNVAVARKRYLTVAEAQRLLNAAEGDFRHLAQAALQTGARYSELARLKVHDFDEHSGTVGIAKSKAGKPRRVYLTEEGVAFFSNLTTGRSGDALMLMRGGEPWQHTNQCWPMHKAVKRAKLEPPIAFHGLRHTYASLALMNGVPMQVVSENLGHTDTRMVEKHYGHLAPSHKRDAIRAGAARFGVVAASKVRPLQGVGRSNLG
jgi:integrase